MNLKRFQVSVELTCEMDIEAENEEQAIAMLYERSVASVLHDCTELHISDGYVIHEYEGD